MSLELEAAHPEVPNPGISESEKGDHSPSSYSLSSCCSTEAAVVFRRILKSRLIVSSL